MVGHAMPYEMLCSGFDICSYCIKCFFSLVIPTTGLVLFSAIYHGMLWLAVDSGLGLWQHQPFHVMV